MKVVAKRKPVDEWTKEEVDAWWESFCQDVDRAVAAKALALGCPERYVQVMCLADALDVGRPNRIPPAERLRLVK